MANFKTSFVFPWCAVSTAILKDDVMFPFEHIMPITCVNSMID